MFKGIFAINTIPAQTGIPCHQEDPDICCRCGVHRSWYKDRLMKGETFIITCRECREALDGWWQKAKEHVNGQSNLN